MFWNFAPTLPGAARGVCRRVTHFESPSTFAEQTVQSAFIYDGQLAIISDVR